MKFLFLKEVTTKSLYLKYCLPSNQIYHRKSSLSTAVLEKELFPQINSLKMIPVKCVLNRKMCDYSEKYPEPFSFYDEIDTDNTYTFIVWTLSLRLELFSKLMKRYIRDIPKLRPEFIWWNEATRWYRFTRCWNVTVVWSWVELLWCQSTRKLTFA